jgi:hypothetical protein
VEVSQDEFAKQLQLSSDDEEGSANGPDPAGSESQVKRTNSGGDIWLSASTATPLEGSIQTPDHSASTTPRSGPNSRPSSRSASSRSLPRNSIHSGYISQGESSVVTVEINIDDAEKGAKRRRAASVANIIRPMYASHAFRVYCIASFSYVISFPALLVQKTTEGNLTSSWRRHGIPTGGDRFPL